MNTIQEQMRKNEQRFRQYNVLSDQVKFLNNSQKQLLLAVIAEVEKMKDDNLYDDGRAISDKGIHNKALKEVQALLKETINNS